MLRHRLRRLDLSRARASNKNSGSGGIRAGGYCETRTAASATTEIGTAGRFMRTEDRRCAENAVSFPKVIIILQY